MGYLQVAESGSPRTESRFVQDAHAAPRQGSSPCARSRRPVTGSLPAQRATCNACAERCVLRPKRVLAMGQRV